MLRELLIGFGLVEIVAPQPVINACERIGLQNPDEAELRSWGISIARLEGLLVVWLLVRGRNGSRLVRTLFGTAGLTAAVYPRPLIRATQELAYENTEDLKLKSWVGPAARLLGILYLLVVALSLRTGSEADAEPEEQE